MPTIDQSLSSNLDMSAYAKADQSNISSIQPIHPSGTRGTFIRCPVPPIGAISPDNLDQYNLGGLVPQYRVFIK